MLFKAATHPVNSTKAQFSSHKILQNFSDSSSHRIFGHMHEVLNIYKCPVRLDLSAESTAIQQCFSLTTKQRTVLSAQ
jgi:hypothetical protein